MLLHIQLWIRLCARTVLSLSPHEAHTHGVKEREQDDVCAPKRTRAGLFHPCTLLMSARFFEPGAVRRTRCGLTGDRGAFIVSLPMHGRRPLTADDVVFEAQGER